MWPLFSLPAQQPCGRTLPERGYGQPVHGIRICPIVPACVSAASPGFTLSGENGPWVAEICRRLDGMPGDRAGLRRALSVKQIAERLDDRFHLLSAGSHTAPPRQQTLVAVCIGSYELLTEAERRSFSACRYSPAAHPEAAEAVCACELSVSHRRKSWVRSHTWWIILGQRRSKRRRDAAHRMLETIRQMPSSKKRPTAAMSRPAGTAIWIISFTGRNDRALCLPDKLLELRQFEVEHDNLRAGLIDSTHEGQAQRAALGRRLRQFLDPSQPLQRGQERLAAALSHPAHVPGRAPCRRAP